MVSSSAASGEATSGKKPASHKVMVRRHSKVAVAYRFSGDLRDLSKALEETKTRNNIQALLVPETREAEEALQRGRGFRALFQGRKVGAAKGYDLVNFTELMARKRVRNRLESAKAAVIGKDAYQPDARARAILRGKAHAEADLKAAGGAFGVDDVRKILNGVTRQAIDKRVNDGALLAVPGPSGHRRFPTVQFNTDGTLVAGLKEVQKALGFSSPWAVLNFLVNANDQLGGNRPIDAMRQGEVARVVSAASSIGVQGA